MFSRPVMMYVFMSNCCLTTMHGDTYTWTEGCRLLVVVCGSTGEGGREGGIELPMCMCWSKEGCMVVWQGMHAA